MLKIIEAVQPLVKIGIIYLIYLLIDFLVKPYHTNIIKVASYFTQRDTMKYALKFCFLYILSAIIFFVVLYIIKKTFKNLTK